MVLHHMKIAAVAAALMAVVMSCNDKPDRVLTEADNGTSITVEKGDLIAVRLKARLGTGFSWKPAVEENGLEQTGPPTQESDEEVKAGGMDTQEFRFKAVSEGTSILTLTYAQPWADAAAPAMKYIVTITVH